MNRTILSVAGVLSASSLLVDSAVKGLVMLMLAAVAALILRRDSAATRHLVWQLAIIAIVVVPVLSALLPQWRVLPAWADISPETAVVAAHPPAISAPETLASETAESEASRPAYRAADVPPGVQPAEGESPFSTVFGPPVFVPESPASPAESAAPQAAPVSAGWNRNWLSALPFVWAIGFWVLNLRLIAARWVLWKNERQAWSATQPEAANARLATALAAACQQLGIRRPVVLLIHPEKTIPVVWGVLRQRLLLPAASRDWSDEQLRSVLLHELAHLKRLDTLAQLLAQIACALHWFNPLVWFAAWRLSVERERACDDLVLASGVRPSAYAGHLLDVVTGLSHARWTQSCGLAMARRSSLESRLVAVLSKKLNRRGVPVALAAIALAIAIGIAVPIAMLRGANDQRNPPKLRVLRTDGSPAQFNGVVEAAVGFAAAKPLMWSDFAAKDGLVPLDKLPDGIHWLVAASDSEERTAFQVALPVPEAPIERRLRLSSGWVSKAIEIKTTVDRTDTADEIIVVEIHNASGAEITVSEDDFSLTMSPGHHRVLAPRPNETAPRGRTPLTIAEGKSGTFRLSWRRWVDQGLWAARTMEAIDEPWSLESQAGRIQLRVYLGNLGAVPIFVTDPQVIAKHAAAGIPRNSTAVFLLKQWQDLEGRETPLSEASVARLRLAIDKWVKQPAAHVASERVRALRDWEADRAEHPVAEVTQWLDEIAAIHAGPLAFAISSETLVGVTLSAERQALLHFGPAAENGLRAAWSRYPVRETYLPGDVIDTHLVIQNVSDRTVEFECPHSLANLVTWEATTRDGRTIEAQVAPYAGTFPLYTWQLKPGAVAEIHGPGVMIDTGGRREDTRDRGVFTLLKATRGEHVTVHWNVREPVAMRTPDVSFQVVGLEDVSAWSTSRAGKWSLSGGVTLEVRQQLVHASDVVSTAILTWPKDKAGNSARHKIWLGVDAFSNRQPWLLAWERGASVLWTLSGSRQSPQDFRKVMATPESLRRIDFSDPANITETRWSFAPDALPEAIRAELERSFLPLPTKPRTPAEFEPAVQTSRAEDEGPVLKWASPLGPQQVAKELVIDQESLASKTAELEKQLAERDSLVKRGGDTAQLDWQIAMDRVRVAGLRLKIAEAGNRLQPGSTADEALQSLKRETLVRWGEPVDGVQIGLERVSLADEFSPGQPVEFRHRVRNTAPEARSLTLRFGSKDNLKMLLYAGNRFTANRTGRPLESFTADLPPGGDQAITGSEFQIETRGMLPDRYHIESYTRFVLNDEQIGSKQIVAAPPGWTRMPSDIPLTFDVVAQDSPAADVPAEPFVLQGGPEISWGQPVQGLQGGLRYTRPLKQPAHFNHRSNWEWELGDTVQAEFVVRNVLPRPTSATFAVAEDEQLIELDPQAHSVSVYDGYGPVQPRRSKSGIAYADGHAPTSRQRTLMLKPGETVVVARLDFQLLQRPKEVADYRNLPRVNAILVEPAGLYSLGTRFQVRGSIAVPSSLPTGRVRLWMRDPDAKPDVAASETIESDVGDGRIALRYDMAGAAPQAEIVIQPLRKSGQTATRIVTNGSTTREIELPAGRYEVFRRVPLKVGGWQKDVSCNRQSVDITAGKVTKVEFVRPRDNLIAPKGLWKHLAAQPVPGAFLTVHPIADNAMNSGNPDYELDYEADRETIAAAMCGPDGSFTLEPLPPGRYLVILRAFRDADSEEASGIVMPYLVGASAFQLYAHLPHAVFFPKDFRIHQRWNVPQWVPTKAN